MTQQVVALTPNMLGAVANVPSYMQGAPDALSGLGGSFASVRRVQMKGGQINFLDGQGNPMGNVLAADGTTVAFPQYGSSADIIIVGMMPEASRAYRTFYATAYEGEGSAPPACWSVDGETPSDKSSAPQAGNCRDCPKNVVGTSATGKGKACGSRKKLAVIYAYDPEMRIFSMDLPATALFGTSKRESEGYYTLSAYAKKLAAAGAHSAGVVTEVSFAEGANIGVRFKAKGYTNEAHFNAVCALRDNEDVKDALHIEFSAPKAEAATAVAPTPDAKAVALANPAFNTTLAFLKDWAAAPTVTYEAIKTEAAKYGVAL